MPLPITLAHALTRRLSDVRKGALLDYLRPDGKSQVTVRYEGDRPVGIEKILISAQHRDGVEAHIKDDLLETVIRPLMPEEFFDPGGVAEIMVNPTGRFVVGGSQGDTGLTGRKIIVDTYGGSAPHGGGAFSGKDPTKVDRSGSYAARWVAKNLVAAGLARRALVEVLFGIVDELLLAEVGAGLSRPGQWHVGSDASTLHGSYVLSGAVGEVAGDFL